MWYMTWWVDEEIVTLGVGGMERARCFPERGMEGLWGWFGDGERQDCGAVVERSLGSEQ